MEKKSSTIRNCLVLITAISLTFIAGCSSQAIDSVSAFDRAQVKTDALPVTPDLGVVADSSRLLFEDSDAQYFAVKSSDEDGVVCFVIYSTPDLWSQSCSSQLPIAIELNGVTKAQLNAMSGDASSDEWDQIADNVALGK